MHKKINYLCRKGEEIMRVKMSSKREAGGRGVDVIGAELAANRLKCEHGIQGDLRFAHTVIPLPPLPLLKKLTCFALGILIQSL
jgi:hypothetical protein